MTTLCVVAVPILSRPPGDGLPRIWGGGKGSHKQGWERNVVEIAGA